LHAGSFPGTIPVIVGDLRKNYVVHGAGEHRGKKLLHVAKPPNDLCKRGADLQAADVSSWSRIRGMLAVMRGMVLADDQGVCVVMQFRHCCRVTTPC
jgi:hypothetical protein